MHAHEQTQETLPSVRARRSQLDASADVIAARLERFPDITAVRLQENFGRRASRAGYAIVKDRLSRVRPQPTRTPVVRFETGPGVQAIDHVALGSEYALRGIEAMHTRESRYVPRLTSFEPVYNVR